MSNIAASLTIGKVARAAGVGVETIRFYERRGLVARPRRPLRGFRSYPPETAERIRFIRQAQELGFTLREIKELLSLRTDPKADCSDIRRKSQEKLAEVIAKSEQLDRMRRALETLIAACPGRGALKACSILDGMAQPAKRTATDRRRTRVKGGGRSTMKTYVIAVEGMHCEGCVSTVKALLEMESGVKAVSVSLKDKTARVLADPAQAEPKRLAAAVNRAGYKATLRAP